MIEVVVTAAIMTLVFGGLLASVQVLLKVIQNSKAMAGANALVVERMEYIRSLAYDDVGTEGGVPAGLIPQTSTTTLNDLTYYERVLVEYVDDAADGVGASDENGILADYKRVKIEYSWRDSTNATSSVSMVSNIVPVGIETTAGGGTIKVNVFDAAVQPVSGAAVHFINDTLSPTIDTTRYTNADGVAYLAGAPAGANYQIEVTDSGYSFDGTYVASSTNPNPITPPIAVVESSVSTMNFQIDRVSDLEIITKGVATNGSFSDDFTNDSLIQEYASTTRSGDTIELVSSAGTYAEQGTVTSTTSSPATLDSWYMVVSDVVSSASTSVSVSVLYDDGGGLSLVPDSDLPGNSTGFTGSTIDLTSLDPTTYSALALRATLSTVDTSVTPSLNSWELVYVQNQPNINSVPLHVQGAKTIGLDSDGNGVAKYDHYAATDGSATLNLSGIEYDVYTIELDTTSYNVVEICPASPVTLDPDTDLTVTMVLDSTVGNSLRVIVEDPTGAPLANATVLVENSGINEEQTTGVCGQTYFSGGLYSASDYTVTVSLSGYTTEVVNAVTVDTNSVVTVVLSN